jgi:hypothetical protein
MQLFWDYFLKTHKGSDSYVINQDSSKKFYSFF